MPVIIERRQVAQMANAANGGRKSEARSRVTNGQDVLSNTRPLCGI
jgi:hypothetical protein